MPIVTKLIALAKPKCNLGPTCTVVASANRSNSDVCGPQFSFVKSGLNSATDGDIFRKWRFSLNLGKDDKSDV